MNAASSIDTCKAGFLLLEQSYDQTLAQHQSTQASIEHLTKHLTPSSTPQELLQTQSSINRLKARLSTLHAEAEDAQIKAGLTRSTFTHLIQQQFRNYSIFSTIINTRQYRPTTYTFDGEVILSTGNASTSLPIIDIFISFAMFFTQANYLFVAQQCLSHSIAILKAHFGPTLYTKCIEYQIILYCFTSIYWYRFTQSKIPTILDQPEDISLQPMLMQPEIRDLFPPIVKFGQLPPIPGRGGPESNNNNINQNYTDKPQQQQQNNKSDDKDQQQPSWFYFNRVLNLLQIINSNLKEIIDNSEEYQNHYVNTYFLTTTEPSSPKTPESCPKPFFDDNLKFISRPTTFIPYSAIQLTNIQTFLVHITLTLSRTYFHYSFLLHYSTTAQNNTIETNISALIHACTNKKKPIKDDDPLKFKPFRDESFFTTPYTLLALEVELNETYPLALSIAVQNDARLQLDPNDFPLDFQSYDESEQRIIIEDLQRIRRTQDIIIGDIRRETLYFNHLSQDYAQTFNKINVATEPLDSIHSAVKHNVKAQQQHQEYHNLVKTINSKKQLPSPPTVQPKEIPTLTDQQRFGIENAATSLRTIIQSLHGSFYSVFSECSSLIPFPQSHCHYQPAITPSSSWHNLVTPWLQPYSSNSLISNSSFCWNQISGFGISVLPASQFGCGITDPHYNELKLFISLSKSNNNKKSNGNNNSDKINSLYPNPDDVVLNLRQHKIYNRIDLASTVHETMLSNVAQSAILHYPIPIEDPFQVLFNIKPDEQQPFPNTKEFKTKSSIPIKDTKIAADYNLLLHHQRLLRATSIISAALAKLIAKEPPLTVRSPYATFLLSPPLSRRSNWEFSQQQQQQIQQQKQQQQQQSRLTPLQPDLILSVGNAIKKAVGKSLKSKKGAKKSSTQSKASASSTTAATSTSPEVKNDNP
jgi:hypothetical protein